MAKKAGLFLENKYSNLYFILISNARSKDRKRFKKSHADYVYYENHHIIPKCMGGSNLPDNLVLLTAKEHFICHLLLTKITIGDNKRKMLFAFRQMSNTSGNQERYGINSRRYQYMKEMVTHTAASKKKMSESHIGLTQTPETIEKRVSKIRGKASPTKGTSLHDSKSRKKIADAQTTLIGNLTPEELRQRMLNSCCNPLAYTAERAAKISKSNTGRIVSDITKEKLSKKTIFISPSGERYEHTGLNIGCKIHEFNYGTVRNKILSTRFYRGWEIFYG